MAPGRVGLRPTYGQPGLQARSREKRTRTSTDLTATLMQARLFQTGSIALPASRFFCEHLHQNLFWACISRIHAQVPVATTGKLTESLNQQIPCGIDVSIMVRPARSRMPRLERFAASLTPRGARCSTLDKPPDALRVTPHIELRAMAQAGAVVLVLEDFKESRAAPVPVTPSVKASDDGFRRFSCARAAATPNRPRSGSIQTVA
jgi:hypothetical protein